MSKSNPYAVLHNDFPATGLLKRSQAMFGREYQMGIAVEECSELQKELMKNNNRKKDNIPEIIDETADVYIALLHIVLSYDINEQVAAKVKYKLDRLNDRLIIRENSKSVEEYTKTIEAQKTQQAQQKLTRVK